ncbi:MAG: hypothetical protein K2Q18_15160 [Bdellovibrionales bacterium]|nr:hypothetical protein [Bdellovibrionales bacterium]
MKKIFLIFIACNMLSSCSYLSRNFETLAENKSTRSLPQKSNRNYCPASSNIQYISEDEPSLKFYRSLHPTLFENKNANFVQKSIMLALLELSRRPDQASPYSRFQVYLKFNGRTYYYDFRPKDLVDDTKMPYLKALDMLTREFVPGTSLVQIASNMDAAIPKSIGVSLEFETFLKENQKDLLKNDILAQRFFKGDEVLTKYESFERINYRQIIDQYTALASKNSDYEFNVNGLTSNISKKENFQVNCNYDLEKETTLTDEIINAELKKTHYMGISEGDNFFIAVSSGTLFRPLKTGKMGYFMKTRPSPIALPICEFKGKNQEIILFSNDGRNPVQHLQHLDAYDIDQVDSVAAMNELLSFSRHLFLSAPERILYESKRGRKAQLDFFLEMNFPIYHVESLGNIFGHATFKTESTLYSDDRSSARLWCKE